MLEQAGRLTSTASYQCKEAAAAKCGARRIFTWPGVAQIAAAKPGDGGLDTVQRPCPVSATVPSAHHQQNFVKI